MTKFYGLTGGIGSGKSTVAAMFEQQAVPVLDLDKIGHHLLQENKAVQTELIQTFGQHIQHHDVIDRALLAKEAFASQTTTQTLNAIMHPRILAYEEDWRQQQTGSFAIIEASVLIESGGVQRMDGVIVVLCDKRMRWQRVQQRGQQDKQRFDSIIERQCSDDERKAVANDILENNAGLQQLKIQVDTLHKKLS